jgi:hypothetical protein
MTRYKFHSPSIGTYLFIKATCALQLYDWLYAIASLIKKMIYSTTTVHLAKIIEKAFARDRATRLNCMTR